MDDKVFNLLEKMYSEFTEFKQDITNKVTQIEIAIETDVKPNVKLALQGYHDTNEKLTSIEDKVNWVKDQQKIDGIKIDITKQKVESMEVKIEKNTKLLEDIQEEVARHEEVIIKRVK